MWYNYLSKIFKIALFFVLFYHSCLSDSLPHVLNIPSENPNFIGREDQIAELSRLLNDTPPKIVVISGAQGFGKTQLAKKFAYQNLKNYDVVWWFRSNQFMKPQFEQFSFAMASILKLQISLPIQAIGHEYLLTIIKEGIRRSNLKCLLIFDDAQTFSEIEPYIPFLNNKKIHIIITTKNGNFSAHSIQINPFKRSDSLKYINLFLSQESDKSKNKLAERFGDCPAALAVSIDYIRTNPGMTIEPYLLKHNAQKLFLPTISMFSQKLGSSVDGYKKDLLVAIQMNMNELDRRSRNAFQFLSLLALLHRDEIPINMIQKWLNYKNIKEDIGLLINMVNQYSLIEVNNSHNKAEPYISMQELIQQIIASQLSKEDKINRINEATKILKDCLTGSSDEVVKAVLKNSTPLLHTIKVSQEADKINYHTPELTSLRILVLNILTGYIRDFETSKKLIKLLENDIKHKVKLSKYDNILYHTNLFIIHAVGSDFDKANRIGKILLNLLNQEEQMYEEKIRFFSNMIQYCSLTGNVDEASKFVDEGKKLLPLSKASEHNCLYIYSTSMYFIDRGEIDKAIDLISKFRKLLDEQASYHPSMRFFTLNLLAESLIKKGNIEEAKHVLNLSEEQGHQFYGDNDHNNFFGRLYVLKAACSLKQLKSFEYSKSLMEKAIAIFRHIYKASDKHRNQAFTHLYLGKLLHHHGQFKQAKQNYLISKDIFEKALKSQKIDDVSDLYKSLVILGVDSKDETLIHVYLKKQLEVFGPEHPRTKEILLYCDEHQVKLPF